MIGIARCARIILFYILLNDFISVLNDKCRNNRKSEINAIKRISNLDTLLRELAVKCNQKEKLTRAGLIRAIVLSKRLQQKNKSMNQLNEVEIKEDKMEIDPREITEIRNREIDKKLVSIESKSEKFFKEAFDFESMEHEYTIKMILESSQDLEFDIFDLETKSHGNELFILAMHTMNKEKFLDEFRISTKKMRNFAYAIQCSYNDVTYHNKTHASDVAQTCYYFIQTCDLISVCNFTRLEQM